MFVCLRPPFPHEANVSQTHRVPLVGEVGELSDSARELEGGDIVRCVELDHFRPHVCRFRKTDRLLVQIVVVRLLEDHVEELRRGLRAPRYRHAYSEPTTHVDHILELLEQCVDGVAVLARGGRLKECK